MRTPFIVATLCFGVVPTSVYGVARATFIEQSLNRPCPSLQGSNIRIELINASRKAGDLDRRSGHRNKSDHVYMQPTAIMP